MLLLKVNARFLLVIIGRLRPRTVLVGWGSRGMVVANGRLRRDTFQPGHGIQSVYRQDLHGGTVWFVWALLSNGRAA